jgi:uncharacterized protein (TIGR00299 family) protein
MRMLYIECNMGAAGDMLMAALYELIPEKSAFLEKLKGLGLPGVSFVPEPSVKCGVSGTHMAVIIDGEEEASHDYHDSQHHGHLNEEHNNSHEHCNYHEIHYPSHVCRGMAEINELISHLDLSEKVKDDVLAVYSLIAEAESQIHCVPVEQVHFHELGSLDALADIVGVCLAIEMLAPEKIVASPVHVGSGMVRCSHGLLPVPAPATEYLLRGIPVYGGGIKGELCTPTGSALLRHFVSEFGNMPLMKVEKVGYGMGRKDFPAANCVRAFWGETGDEQDDVLELCCNLDDMTPEAMGFAMERLLEAGALDVYTTPVGMKKNRPGILLSCMCKADRREEMLRQIFLHTTTLGIREYRCRRYILERSMRAVETKYGPVRVKRASGWGVQREKPEYEDLAKIAREQGTSLSEISCSLAKE